MREISRPLLEATVQSGMREGKNAFFHCFIVVAYWSNRQHLTNEILFTIAESQSMLVNC